VKEVYVLRHAAWNGKSDVLTEQGKGDSEKCAAALPRFNIVYSSPFNRAQQTAKLISGAEPRISEAASVPQSPPEVRDQILTHGKVHPLGVAGALFDTEKAYPALERAGQALIQLIQRTLNDLEEDQKALIVSHDGTMVSTARILTGVAFDQPLLRTYNELEGFVVDADHQMRSLYP
jgi:broad specificity phosphatase PhoE